MHADADGELERAQALFERLQGQRHMRDETATRCALCHNVLQQFTSFAALQAAEAQCQDICREYPAGLPLRLYRMTVAPFPATSLLLNFAALLQST